MGPRRHLGFTVIELVMVIVIFGIIGAMVAPLISTSFQSYFTSKDISDTDWQARAAIERMTRDLRGIRAPADLTITSGSDITYVDIDGNTVRYCMGAVGGCPGAAGDLMRNGQALASGVSALTFSFLTRTACATATPAQVFYVTFGFTDTQKSIANSYTATVSPRNFP
jgi:MSHA biogenesis protein MshO